MLDPLEGIGGAGEIRTGVARDRVDPRFDPVLEAAVPLLLIEPGTSLYVYGSVSTGRADLRTSDVDLLTIGVDPLEAADAQALLTARFADRCRAVEIAVAQPEDYRGDGAPAYGNRVFLRHYCAFVAGIDRTPAVRAFPADRRAAKGFNGDIARMHREWRALLAITASRGDGDLVELGRRVARKTLLALSGLISVLDGIWTTDRATAAARWRVHAPDAAVDLHRLEAISAGRERATADGLRRLLAPGGVIDGIVTAFSRHVGLWA